MSAIRASKVVNALPGVLDADTVYFVRLGAGFDIYVTNASGMIVAYPLNQGGASQSGVATVTLPYATGATDWTETLTVAGMTPDKSIIAAFAAGADTEENSAEMLSRALVSAVAGAGSITFISSFDLPECGPIKIVWKVIN